MGSRTERLRAAQADADHGPASLTRATESGVAEKRAPVPVASRLVSVLGLLLVILAAALLVIVMNRGYQEKVSDGTYLAIIVLFVGGFGLVGLGAVIRQLAARR
jgi:hypothetical protein